MELNQERIENAIVAEVADKIISDDALYSRVKQAVDDRIDRHFREVADAQIRAEIELAISGGFEREYTKLTSFGEAREKTPIRAELEKLIGGYWNTPVDKNGKPGSSYGANVTRAEWMMTQLVAADFQGEMKQHVINLGGALKDKLREELHETVNKLLSEVFYVRSQGDQAADRRDSSIIRPHQKEPS